MDNLATRQRIENRIYFVRGQKVILDHDLAELYEVETKVLKQQVNRNTDRFPEDFMFELTWEEAKSLRSQIVTLNNNTDITPRRGKHIKYRPYAFTEQGVAMLSSVLNSKRAIHVNIQIMRTFTKLREILSTHKDLQKKIEEMEKKYDNQFTIVFDAIKALLTASKSKIKKIGFVK